MGTDRNICRWRANASKVLPVDSCAITSDPKAKFISIVATAATPGTDTLAIAFSGQAFTGVHLTVQYGPFSTHPSVAASIAAMVTSNYAMAGLVAKAIGSSVIFSGIADLGAVSVTGGSSFGTVTTSTAASSTATACYALPKVICGGQIGFFDYDTAKEYDLNTEDGDVTRIEETPRQHILRKHIRGTTSAANTVYLNPGGYSDDTMFELVEAYNFATYIRSKSKVNPFLLTYEEKTLNSLFGTVDKGWIALDMSGQHLHTNKLYLSGDRCRVSTSFPIAP